MKDNTNMMILLLIFDNVYTDLTILKIIANNNYYDDAKKKQYQLK